MLARIIVSCGSGVATAKTVAVKVSKLLEEKGLKADVQAVEATVVKQYLKSADVYIPIVQSNLKLRIPVLNGIAFLTGMGQEAELAKLVSIIEKH